MRRARWRIVEAGHGYLVIKDIGPWNIHKTVTNDIEKVVEDLLFSGFLLPSQRLFCIDSEGNKDEILLDATGFKGFNVLHNESCHGGL